MKSKSKTTLLAASLLLVFALGGCSLNQVQTQNTENQRNQNNTQGGINNQQNSQNQPTVNQNQAQQTGRDGMRGGMRFIDVEKLGLTTEQITAYKALETAEEKAAYLKELGVTMPTPPTKTDSTVTTDVETSTESES
jgi:hypothetical protein